MVALRISLRWEKRPGPRGCLLAETEDPGVAACGAADCPHYRLACSLNDSFGFDPIARPGFVIFPLRLTRRQEGIRSARPPAAVLHRHLGGAYEAKSPEEEA